MRYYDLSPKQLEDRACDLLIEFDQERLRKTKPIDVYAVIEKCLDVPYDWKYLTPDQSILGATAFSGGLLWVWPESKYYEGLLPYQIEVEPGTILIDTTLTEQDNRGRENFTVMHEVFHQVLHKKCFRTMPKNYVHPTASRTIDGQVRYASYALAMIEKQANACAAAFLMPADLTRNTYKYLYRAAGFNRYNYGFVYNTIKEMAEEFSVSQQAMSIRIQTLGLIDENKENLFE
jgi:hypothetical protein